MDGTVRQLSKIIQGKARPDRELAIVVCKEYQNLHIGRRCISEMIELAREKGMNAVTANIYSFNRQSQRMFESVGFVKTGEEWYAYDLSAKGKNNTEKEYINEEVSIYKAQ